MWGYLPITVEWPKAVFFQLGGMSTNPSGLSFSENVYETGDRETSTKLILLETDWKFGCLEAEQVEMFVALCVGGPG